MTTKRDVDKSPFLIVKNQQNDDVKLVVSPSNFQVGLTNSPSSLTVTGHATFQQGVTSNNPVYFYQGLSGSLTKLTDGTSYLVAGNNVTITSASNGQVTISSTAGGGGSGDVVGPASATDNAIVRFDLTTGKLIQDSAVTIADTTGNITTPGDIAVNGGDVTTTAGTATLFNTNATILNLGGAATTIEIGAATGTTSVNNSLTVDGSATLGDAAADVITVNGTTTFVGAGVTTTFAGDIAINGGDVTTTAATFNIANANATTVNIGGAATTVGVGSSTGVTTINNRLSATGGTFLLLDAELGNAAVGSHPAFESTTPTVYALFGHKDLNHAVDGNYALVQSNAGDTFIGASSTCDIYFKNGTDAIGQLSNDTVSFTGKSGTATTATIGNTTGASTTTINAGTGGIDIDHVGTATINIGTNNETRTTNISTGAANQTVTVGSNYGGSTLALRGGSDSSGGQIDVETGTGGGGNGGDINIGATSYARRVNLGTGGNSTAQDVTIGSTYLGSDIKIYAGQAGVINIGSNSVTGRTINIATGQTDGNTNIGTSTGTGMLNLHTGTGDINIGTSDYTRTVKIGSDTSCITRQTVNVAPLNTGNYNIVKICDGASNTGHEVRIISENSSQSGGYALVKIGTIANTCQTTIGNNSSNSFTKIYGGANGVTIDVQAGSSINVGGTDAVAQSVTIGNITGASTTTIQAGSGGITFTGDATLSGDLAVNGGDITTTAGTFNLVNAASTINLGSTAVTRAINIGTNATNVQTINVGTGNAANAITIGTQTGAGSTTIKAGSGNVNLDSTNFINLKYNGNTVGYVGPGFLWYEVNFSGLNNIMNLSYFGNSYGGSGTYIRAGSGAINLSGSATTTITGSTSGQADAHIGDVEIGSLPGFAGQYAMFGHKDLNHSFGNYAIAQQNDGTTYLNAPEDDYVYFTSAGNPAHNGYIGYNTVFGTLINFQGRSGQRAAVTIGNATSTSATSIYAGSGGITLSGSGGQTVITGSTTSYTDATIGAWEIGSLPATQGTFPNVYAFIGHKDLNHSSDGNYALVQSNVGDTFIGAVSTKDVYFKNGTSFIGQISNDTISFTGSPAASVTTVVGSVTGSSSTSIYAGSGGLYLSGSATTTTPGTIITGSRPTSVSDAYIGPLEVGVWPSNVGYGMIMHKDLAYTNEYALLQQNNGNTYLNCGAAASTLLRYNGTTRIQLNSTGIGFFGATPVAKQTVASDTLANLYTALRNYGLIV